MGFCAATAHKISVNWSLKKQPGSLSPRSLGAAMLPIEEVRGPLAFFVSISLPFIFKFPPAFWEGETVP
jgi:hypothetical protein